MTETDLTTKSSQFIEPSEKSCIFQRLRLVLTIQFTVLHASLKSNQNKLDNLMNRPFILAKKVNLLETLYGT